MTGNVVYGDLIALAEQGQFDFIVHGCNLHGTMGSGIARAIADRYPQALEADRASMHLPHRLGTFTSVKVPGNELDHFVIINGYTQENYGTDKRQVDYDAVRNVFRLIRSEFSKELEAGAFIGYPLIGADRGGGDWEIISEIIDEELAGCNHTLVRFSG